MRLNRNPLVVGMALTAVWLAGCGAAPTQHPTKGLSPTSSATALRKPSAQLPVEALVEADIKASKDWQIISGTVTQLLPDDSDDRPHQHFLFKMDSGKIVKVAHNTALAPHVPVKVGGVVKLKCEYIKSKPYDVAHWTHYDPAGGEGGYIEYQGKVYDRL